MNIVIETILILAWIVWVGVYWKLAWTKGSADGPSFLKIFFPVFILFNSSWPAGTEIALVKLQLALFIILFLTFGAHYVGLVPAT